MIYTFLCAFLAGFQTQQSLVLENLALRHQFQVLNREGVGIPDLAGHF
jgi:hypothetical protein